MSDHRNDDRADGSVKIRGRRATSVGFACRSCCSGWPSPALTNIARTAAGGRRRGALGGVERAGFTVDQAMRHIGQVFNEFDSDSAAMIVLEGDQPLGRRRPQLLRHLVKRLARTPSTLSTFRTSGGTR